MSTSQVLKSSLSSCIHQVLDDVLFDFSEKSAWWFLIIFKARRIQTISGLCPILYAVARMIFLKPEPDAAILFTTLQWFPSALRIQSRPFTQPARHSTGQSLTASPAHLLPHCLLVSSPATLVSFPHTPTVPLLCTTFSLNL